MNFCWSPPSLSGWYTLLNLRYCFLISAIEAPCRKRRRRKGAKLYTAQSILHYARKVQVKQPLACLSIQSMTYSVQLQDAVGVVLCVLPLHGEHFVGHHQQHTPQHHQHHHPEVQWEGLLQYQSQEKPIWYSCRTVSLELGILKIPVFQWRHQKDLMNTSTPVWIYRIKHN